MEPVLTLLSISHISTNPTMILSTDVKPHTPCAPVSSNVPYITFVN